MIQTHCPDAARWRELLTEADPPDSAELEAHLSGCARCRTLLDEIAVGESGWLRDAARLAGPPDTDPEMTKTLHRLREYLPDDDHGPPIPLDFLTPSDQPGVLGTLGRYQVLEVIGRGAMGVVLKALDPDLLRPVAIKVMAPYLAPSGTARQRFLREARAAAAVRDDNIVTIHAVEPAELPYLVMEYVSGISLQARLDRDGPLPPRDIARIGMQAANGLAAAHKMGLAHRDIKPANILLENGVERVKITDFGLARAADDARLTQSGTAAGTPLYMSPEQARGETVDHRSDLFSLGSVLYTLATGFPPFRAGSTMGVLNRIANDPPRPIRETVPDFPAALEGIIMQLLQKDPDHRIQVAADVSIKLTGFLADPQPEPHRPRRRLPKWWETSLPVLAGILVLGTILYFKTNRGTLVVDVDDPAVTVRIVGDELNIHGAGPQVVSLKPGVYQVQAADVYGTTVAVEPQIVTIERNGKQIVKVTVKPNDPPARLPPADAADTNTDALLEERIKNILPDAQPDRLNLMRSAWREAKSKKTPPVTGSGGVREHAWYPKVRELMLQADDAGIDPDRLRSALTTAHDLAGTILKETTAVAPKKDESKIDPAWDKVLKQLADQFESLRNRLVGTKGSRFVTLATPVADLDKATAGLTEPDRTSVKRLLQLRDEFAEAREKALKVAGRLGENRGRVPGKEVEKLEDELRTHYEVLATRLGEMETLAVVLGAKLSEPPKEPTWDDRLKKLTDEFKTLRDRLAKTKPGGVLDTTAPGADPDRATAGLAPAEAVAAKKLLVLRDRFERMVPQFRIDIGQWEKAAQATKDRRQKAEAGMISLNELEAAQIEQTAAGRVLTGAEQEMAGILSDLGKLADELTGTGVPANPAGAAEAEFKKTLAEYDSLTLRLVNTPTGRALALTESDNLADGDLTTGGVPPTAVDTARRLLAVRAKIRVQKVEAEAHLFDLHRSETGAPAQSAALQGLKFRTGAIRGLVDDLKKLADEIDPPPTADAEFKKVMAEYDALVLRLAKTTGGRLLAITKPGNWGEGDITVAVGPDQTQLAAGKKLLWARDQINYQSSEAGRALKDLEGQRQRLKELKEQKAAANRLAEVEDQLRKAEQQLKFRTVTLGEFVGDVRWVADLWDPPAKKTGDSKNK
jgi:hypothetical protein